MINQVHNNTCVRFQMLQVNLQLCCMASYKIAEQVAIVNLVALRGCSGGGGGGGGCFG